MNHDEMKAKLTKAGISVVAGKVALADFKKAIEVLAGEMMSLPKSVSDTADVFLQYADLQVGVAGTYSLKSTSKNNFILCFVWDDSKGDLSDIEVVISKDGKPVSYKVGGTTFPSFAKAFSQAYGEEV